MALALRILRFPLVLIILGIAAVVAPIATLQFLLDRLGLGDHGWAALATYAAQAAIGLAGYLAYTRWVERRPARELSWGGAELLLGLVIGAVMFKLVIGSIWLAGGIQFDGWNPAPDLMLPLGIAIASGITEELIVRGVIFRHLEGWLGSWAALALSAGFFGAVHLGNPNATLVAGIAIALEAGLMLASAYMVTRRLWLPIGIHIAWNFVQPGIFGVAVSGNAIQGLLITHPTGSDLVSGGAFGAEASTFAVLWGLVLTAIFLTMAWRRGHFIAWLGRTQT